MTIQQRVRYNIMLRVLAPIPMELFTLPFKVACGCERGPLCWIIDYGSLCIATAMIAQVRNGASALTNLTEASDEHGKTRDDHGESEHHREVSENNGNHLTI